MHFSLNCLFSNCHSLCFPLRCADIIYLFYETTTPSKKNKKKTTSPPTPDSWMDWRTDRRMHRGMDVWWMNKILIGLNSRDGQMERSMSRGKKLTSSLFCICQILHRKMVEEEKWSGKRSGPELVIPHYVKLNFPSCFSFIWCHYGDCVCLVAGK